ncbi:kinetochore component CENP-S-domain-containing protein [Linnemannia elongata]|nr:kinetochore component CENP-S-domain-containing protein [Linnemannia elongata]KAK5814620.1 kinetochore component CENP-S-domain-containing protein [Linnemannia elongata]
MSDNDEGPRERLKAAVWFTVGEICNAEKERLNVAITPQLIASLAEIVFAQAETLGKDLEMFAKHAKRSTVNVDDVKLAARRNSSLYELMAAEADILQQRSKGAREARKRKKVA